jgi:regulator of replication initiation timing
VPAQKQPGKESVEKAADLAAEMYDRLKKLQGGMVESDGGLTVELERLKSRLAQAKRDHQRSAEDIGLLEREIRQVQLKLRALKAAQSRSE